MDSTEDAPGWVLVLTSVLAIIIAVLGFVGNLLTILALPYSKRLKNAATCFVVNLAVVEGLFCVTILPMSAAHLFSLFFADEKLFSSEGCSVFVFLRYVIIQTELLSIAAIAINRCLLIADPDKHRKVFTIPKSIAMIVMIWVVSAAIMLIPLLRVYGEFTYNYTTKECDFSDSKESGGEGPRKLFLAIGFLLPCAVIIISYSYIFYKARRSTGKVKRTKSDALLKAKGSIKSSTEVRTGPADGLRKRDIRIARTIGGIFLAFIICCTPVSLAHYFDNKYHNLTLLLLLHPVYWTQYCINIFIYVFMNKQYLDAYVNYISRWWPNFREVAVTKFKWQEDQRSYNSKTKSTTFSNSVRFASRNESKSSIQVSQTAFVGNPDMKQLGDTSPEILDISLSVN
ncbi:protein trapped in endoderm-1-like isoform X2 [Macrobrachium nipponense]|uniref:protein trapped in endoderm-1-like isoform X2 n=1 Tax=Macrobrachium nipponense TaxID=159736 RepID=UPI0030C8750E